MSIKLAIIGFGSMGRKHYDALLRLGIRIDCILDTKDIELGKIKTFSKIKELLKENITTAIIATPKQTHKYLAMECLTHNINLLIEKPASESVSDIDEIINNANNNKVAVGYIERFNPAIDCLVNEIKNERLINITMVRENPLRGNSCVLRELSVHDVDLARFITGKEPQENTHIFSSSKNVKIHINCANIPVSIFTKASTEAKKRMLYVYTENAYYKVNLLSKTVEKYNKHGKNTKLPVEDKDSLQEELKSFMLWQSSDYVKDNRLSGLNDAKKALSLLGFHKS